MTWTITFYSETVKDEPLTLPSGIQANLLQSLELLE